MSASQAESREFESRLPLHSRTSVLLAEELPLRELLFFALGDRVRRHLLLKTKTNAELFDLYKKELALTITNRRNLRVYQQTLDKFHDFLGEAPPSALLAK